MRSRSLRATALASALAVGSTALVAGGPAQASLPGTGSVLTTSNGTTTLSIFGDSSRTKLVNPLDGMTDVTWSPDGSRAAYLNPSGAIRSIRFNDASAPLDVLLGEVGVERQSLSWRGTGSSLVWAEKDTNGTNRWVIRDAPSSSGWYGTQLTPDDGQDYLNPDGGVQRLVVFQRQADNGSGQPTGQPAVMLYNPASGISVVDDNGSNPAISPDAKRVAFVRGGQIIVSDLAGDNEVVVASSTTNDNPTWSPDGQRIAFNNGTSVVTAAADGSQAGSPTTVAIANGVPAYQPRNQDRTVRLAGSNRFTTATAASKSHWATYGASGDQREQAQAVVLSRSDTFADALSGSALAAAKGGPLLMTPTNSLNVDTANEIKRVLAPGGTVYVLGSEGALSAAVATAVQNLGFKTKRLQGSNRFSTSVAIAQEINPNPQLVLLATGMNFPDALAAGAAAGSFRGDAVVLLTQDAIMPAPTKAFLDTLPQDSRFIFGVGQDAYKAAEGYDQYAIDVYGNNRFETAYAAAWWFFGGENYAGVATGLDWPDALSGGALMGRLNGPLLLTYGTSSNMSVAATWRLDESSGSVGTGLVFGSTAVVNAGQQSQLGTWIGGPLGSTAAPSGTVVGLTEPSKVGTNLRQADATTAKDASQLANREEAAARIRKLREQSAAQ